MKSFKQIGIDLIGPLKETVKGHVYLLTVTDYFSKWAEAEPIKNKSAVEVADKLLRIFFRYVLCDSFCIQA